MEWPPNFVNKIAGDGAGPNKESKNTSQWQREPKHIFLQWRRTQKRGPKKFPTEIGVFVVFVDFSGKLFWTAFSRSAPVKENVLWLALLLRSVLRFLIGPHRRPKFCYQNLGFLRVIEIWGCTNTGFISWFHG